jgi:malate/lactate dehydrogenase
MVVDSTKQLVKNVATGGAVEVSATAGTRYAVAVAGAEVLASIR